MKELERGFDRFLDALREGRKPDLPDQLVKRLEGFSKEVPSAHRSKGLKIALVCREYPPETAHGGMATFSYQLARGLVEAGHSVTVIAEGTSGIQMDFDDRIPVFRIKARLRGSSESFHTLLYAGKISWAQYVFLHSLASWEQIRILERAWGPFDILDLPEHSGEAVVSAVFQETPRTLRLYTPWSLLHEMRATLTPRDDGEALFLMERASLRRADVIMSPSRDLAGRSRTFFGLHTPVSIVPNPIDSVLFRPKPAPDGVVRVCFVGRLEERKGFRVLLRALPAILSASPDIEFRIVGRDINELKKVHGGKFDPSRVRFQDPVPLTRLPEVYQESHISVVPSLYDNSPYTALEPMACGIPVIGTRSGGTSEYVRHDREGLIVPAGDPGALADAVLTLARDPALRKRLGRAGRNRALTEFHYKPVTRRTLENYDHAAGKKKRTDSGPKHGPDLLAEDGADRIRVEVMILADPGERERVEKTLHSLIQAGGNIQATTVLWSGSDPPRIPGCHVMVSPLNRSGQIARAVASTLADVLAVIPAGTILSKGELDQKVWSLLTGEDDDPAVFRSTDVHGVLFPEEDATWRELLRFLSGIKRPNRNAETGPSIASSANRTFPPKAKPVASRTMKLLRSVKSLKVLRWMRPVLFHPRLGFARRGVRHLLLRNKKLAALFAPLLDRTLVADASWGPASPDRYRARRTFLAEKASRGKSLLPRGDKEDVILAALHSDEPVPDVEFWGLDRLVPEAHYGRVLDFLLRFRSQGSVEVSDDFPDELLPAHLKKRG